jgi:hypothetical protein
MQVTSNELNAIKMIVMSQKNLASLGEFEGKQDVIQKIKTAKKVWWSAMRKRYDLGVNKGNRKLSIELDGDKAGELRYKAANETDKANVAGRVVQPHQQAEETRPQGNGSNESQASIAAEVARNIVAALGPALEAAGLEVRPKHAGNGAGGSPQIRPLP